MPRSNPKQAHNFHQLYASSSFGCFLVAVPKVLNNSCCIGISDGLVDPGRTDFNMLKIFTSQLGALPGIVKLINTPVLKTVNVKNSCLRLIEPKEWEF